MGFALVFGGSDAVVWYEPIKEFPYAGGIVPIIISWFLSPLLAALITLILFLLVRTFVLRRANSTKIAFWVLPILMMATFFINLFFILVSGPLVRRQGLDVHGELTKPGYDSYVMHSGDQGKVADYKLQQPSAHACLQACVQLMSRITDWCAPVHCAVVACCCRPRVSRTLSRFLQMTQPGTQLLVQVVPPSLVP
jgi:phosphate/sulfate permease